MSQPPTLPPLSFLSLTPPLRPIDGRAACVPGLRERHQSVWHSRGLRCREVSIIQTVHITSSSRHDLVIVDHPVPVSHHTQPHSQTKHRLTFTLGSLNQRWLNTNRSLWVCLGRDSSKGCGVHWHLVPMRLLLVSSLSSVVVMISPTARGESLPGHHTSLEISFNWIKPLVH